MGKLLIWLRLKSNDELQSLFTVTKGIKGGPGTKPQKLFGTMYFQTKENAHFDINRALKRADPTSCAPNKGFFR